MTSRVAETVRLVAKVAADTDAEEIPRQVCAAVRDGLGVDGATMSLLTDTPSRQLLAATDDVALQLEQIQFTVLEGPCLTAAQRGESVAVDDLRSQLTPWPLFGATVREKLPRVESIYALPLFFGDYVLGSLDLLAFRPYAMSAAELEEAESVAEAVSAALMSTRDVILTGEEPPSWAPAETIRAHWFDTARAIGVLTVRRGLAPENALALMRAEAFRTGRSLADITADVLREPPGRA
ncbi:GAF domain-containing protein [Streptomyces sp. NPDC054842]